MHERPINVNMKHPDARKTKGWKKEW